MNILFPSHGIRAGRAFSLLAILFILTFGSTVALVVIDQQNVHDVAERLKKQTMPEIIRHQRLSRNLEQLRQEGERFFSANSAQTRQQALFVATLVASHPSVLEHHEAAQLARQTEQFLSEVMRQSGGRESALVTRYEEWQRLAESLGVLVDDISIHGANLATADLSLMSETMAQARFKLLLALLVVSVFLAGFLIVLRAQLIQPLQRIDSILSGMHSDQTLPVFQPSPMVEIQAIEAAIGELHDMLLQNEESRVALEHLANKDGLTGLTNRRHFLLTAEAELQRAQRYNRPLSIGMADLDFFKNLNDTYGHAAGDVVLRSFAALLQDTFRQSDLVCRYGGEEFAFLFPESLPADALVLAERFRIRWSEYDNILPDGTLIRGTVSIGMANAATGSLDDILKAADDALYEAKRQGRNRTVVAGAADQTVNASLPKVQALRS